MDIFIGTPQPRHNLIGPLQFKFEQSTGIAFGFKSLKQCQGTRRIGNGFGQFCVGFAGLIVGRLFDQLKRFFGNPLFNDIDFEGWRNGIIVNIVVCVAICVVVVEHKTIHVIIVGGGGVMIVIAGAVIIDHHCVVTIVYVVIWMVVKLLAVIECVRMLWVVMMMMVVVVMWMLLCMMMILSSSSIIGVRKTKGIVWIIIRRA